MSSKQDEIYDEAPSLGSGCSDSDTPTSSDTSFSKRQEVAQENGAFSIPPYIAESLKGFNKNTNKDEGNESDDDNDEESSFSGFSVLKNGEVSSIPASPITSDENPFVEPIKPVRPPPSSSDKAFYKSQKSDFDPENVFVDKTLFKVLDLCKKEELDEFNELYNSANDSFSNKKIVSCSLKETSDGWRVLVKYNILKFLNTK